MRIGVIGGGISGLSAAYRLRRAGHDAVVLEADERVGGKIRSERSDGWLVEHGPNGYLDSRLAIVRLVRDIGLSTRLCPADTSAEKRYLFVDGALKAVPQSPPAFLRSDILSLPGRMRMLREPFVPPRKAYGDESVYSFASRRVGAEAAEKLVDPLVTGIYAGDVARLSLPAAFPRLRALEEQHGGLVRGMLSRMFGPRDASSGGPGGPGGHLTSFPDGMSEVIRALVECMDASAVQTGRPVQRIERLDGKASHTWRLHAAGGDPLDVHGLVFATPAPTTATLLGDLAPAAVRPLRDIPYAPAAVVALGYRVTDLPRPLDGFGFLVPSREKRDILGVLWSSSIFRDRAPGGHALLRCIVGGRHRPELLGLGDASLLATVRADLAKMLGGSLPAPVFQRLVRWPEAIPQYELGHLDRKAAAEAAVAALPGVVLASNALYGVSLTDCAQRAEEVPEAMAAALRG